jgi:hypothetical protein
MVVRYPIYDPYKTARERERDRDSYVISVAALSTTWNGTYVSRTSEVVKFAGIEKENEYMDEIGMCQSVCRDVGLAEAVWRQINAVKYR